MNILDHALTGKGFFFFFLTNRKYKAYVHLGL